MFGILPVGVALLRLTGVRSVALFEAGRRITLKSTMILEKDVRRSNDCDAGVYIGGKSEFNMSSVDLAQIEPSKKPVQGWFPFESEYTLPG